MGEDSFDSETVEVRVDSSHEQTLPDLEGDTKIEHVHTGVTDPAPTHLDLTKSARPQSGLTRRNGLAFGKYTLLARVGAGGMADVRFAFEQTSDGVRPCVVKRIAAEHLGDEAVAAMFAEEGRIGTRLVHPNIVRTYAAGQVDAIAFIAFEFIDGLNLSQLQMFVDPEPFPLSVSLECAIGVAQALSYAHGLVDAQGKSLSMVHRDVAPQNVLVSRDGQVKLADFGIARFEGRAVHTAPGATKGKLRYMSPEQLRLRAVDARSDLFSLGVVLTEMITNDVLLPDGPVAVANLENKIRRSMPDDAPVALTQLLVSLTAREPDDRPSSAAAVVTALNDLLDGIAVRVSLAEYLRGTVLSALPRVTDDAYEQLLEGLSRSAERKFADEYRPDVSEDSLEPVELSPEASRAALLAPAVVPDEEEFPTVVGLLMKDVLAKTIPAITRLIRPPPGLVQQKTFVEDLRSFLEQPSEAPEPPTRPVVALGVASTEPPGPSSRTAPTDLVRAPALTAATGQPSTGLVVTLFVLATGVVVFLVWLLARGA